MFSIVGLCVKAAAFFGLCSLTVETSRNMDDIKLYLIKPLMNFDDLLFFT